MLDMNMIQSYTTTSRYYVVRKPYFLQKRLVLRCINERTYLWHFVRNNRWTHVYRSYVKEFTCTCYCACSLQYGIIGAHIFDSLSLVHGLTYWMVITLSAWSHNSVHYFSSVVILLSFMNTDDVCNIHEYIHWT